MSTSSILIAVAITATVSSALIGMLMVFLSRQSKMVRYNDERHRTELEVMRKSFEERIYALTAQMTATMERWKDANHLIISGQQADTKAEGLQKETPQLEFLKQLGIAAADYRVDRRLVFVLIPFHPDFQDLYKSIQAACQDFGLVCLRGDEEYVTRDVLAHVLKLMVKARLVIAVVEGRNPNVFYELGIAHSLGKTVLTLAKSQEEISSVPIDVRNNRILFYESLENLKQKLVPELTKALIAD
jgi:hypothetical protein